MEDVSAHSRLEALLRLLDDFRKLLILTKYPGMNKIY